MPTPETQPIPTPNVPLPLAALLVLALVTSPAPAQPPPGPVVRPTVSPYLNLLQGRAPTVTNYYGVVRPVQELQRQGAQITNQLSTLQTRYGQSAGQADLPDTGHAAGFMTASNYFLTLNNRGPTRPPPAPSSGGTAPTTTGRTQPTLRR